MKIRSAVVATVLLLSCSGVYAQSSHDIEAKYEKSVDVYSVSENLWMTPSFDSQGQVCTMRVYPKAVGKNVNYLGSDLDKDQALKFINEVFPVAIRGRRGEGFGMSTLMGRTGWTEFKYEHVSFVFIFTFQVPSSEKLKESIVEDFPVVDEAELLEYRKREEMKSDDQLMRERTGSARILEIRWTNRKCVKP